MKKNVLLLMMMVLYAAGIAAQQPAAGNKDTATRSLDEVVVTAQRQERQVLLLPASVNTMQHRQLAEAGSRSTPEALMAVNGVFVQKTNHGGGSPFVRGLTGNQLLVLVDGIRLNNSTFRYGPNQYLNTIDVFTIKRIEVLKGTGSVQYGTDAIGGVLNILSQDPEFSATGKAGWKGRLAAKYTTGNMEKTVRGEALYAGKKLAMIAGITKKKFGDLVGGDTTGSQSPSGYDEWSADFKAKYLLKPGMQLIFATQFLQQQSVPVYHKVRLENFAINEMDPQQRLLSYARLQVNGHSRMVRGLEATLSFQQQTEGRKSRKNGSSILRSERDNTSTAGLTIDIFSHISKAWTANSGIELYHDKVSSSRKDTDMQSGTTAQKRGLYPDGSRYGNYSVYTLHHLRFGKWMADAGLRFNAFRIQVTDTSLGKTNITPSAIVGNAALMYQLSSRQTIYASFSSGFRAPNIDDMGTLGIVDFRYEVPAPGLQPEQAQHTEIGYKFKSSNFSGTAAFYYMHLSSLITRVKMEGQTINGYPVYRKENTEAAYIKGIETEAEWRLTKQLNLGGGIAFAYGQNPGKNEPLRRIPPFNGRLMAAYREKKWFAAAECLFAAKQSRLAQGDKDDNRIPAGGTPGWQVVNLYGGYQLSCLRVNAGMQNLLNRDYRTHGSGINGQGRSGWISLQLNIN
jgi:hemoglobin/transferrin/lactoferrin receptor protein